MTSYGPLGLLPGCQVEISLFASPGYFYIIHKNVIYKSPQSVTNVLKNRIRAMREKVFGFRHGSVKGKSQVKLQSITPLWSCKYDEKSCSYPRIVFTHLYGSPTIIHNSFSARRKDINENFIQTNESVVMPPPPCIVSMNAVFDDLFLQYFGPVRHHFND